MVKSPIKVIVRTRPTSNIASSNININEQANQINFTIPRAEAQGYVNHQQENWNFKFDKVLHNKNQETVFENSAKEILKSALKGYSGTVFCYGQTSAGKTYTMNGDPLKLELKGLIPRTIHALFKEIQNRCDQTVTCKVSYVEIYNETISDLLNPDSNSNITIKEDSKKRIFLKGVTHKVCNTEKETLKSLLEGDANRTISPTLLNSKSSRSHTIFTIHLEIRSNFELNEKIISSKINLVDLAGSERTKKTKSEGKTLVEANYINKSLFFLEQMVMALSEKQREHVPYRHSKLTYLLKDSIGGNSKTIMIANIFPESSNLEESISTLKFATRMMKVSNEATIHFKVDPQALIKKYEQEIKHLQNRLVTQSGSGEKKTTDLKYSSEQKKTQYKQAKSFLKNKTKEIEIESLAHAHALIRQLKRAHKTICKNLEKKHAQPVKDVQVENEASLLMKMSKKGHTKHRSLVMKSVTEDDLKNSTRDFSIETLQTESDQKDLKIKSYYVYPVKRMNDYERNEFLSQSNTLNTLNTLEEKDLTEEINQPKKNKFLDSSIQSPMSPGDIQGFKDLIQKTMEIKSLQSIQDDSPKEVSTDVIRSENDLKYPKRRFKQAAERINELKNTIHQINYNIHQANSLLLKKFDAYSKKGAERSLRTMTEENFNFSYRSDASISKSLVQVDSLAISTIENLV